VAIRHPSHYIGDNGGPSATGSITIVYLHVCFLKILDSAHAVYLCVLFRPQNKQEKFPYTNVSCWFLQHILRDFRTANQNLYICIYVSVVSFLKRQRNGSGSYILMLDGGLNQILT